MKNSPTLFIITFLLFITDLNHSSVSGEENTTKTVIFNLLDSTPLRNLSKLLNSSDLENTNLKVVSIITKESNGTKIVTNEHLSNESLATKEIKKNLSNKDQLTKEYLNKPKLNENLLKKKLLNTTAAKTITKVQSPHQTDKKTNECSQFEFDFLVLSLNWPVNICTKRACILNSPQRYFINSLSPIYNNSQDNRQLPSQCCKKRPFNTSELGSITNELKEHWASVLATKPDETTWFEEWSNYGTCFNSNEKLNTIPKYFSETVRLFKEVDLEQWLKEKNIVPLDDITKVYDFKSFYDAIYVKRPFKYQVVCNPLVSNNTTVSIIDSINLCYDKNLKQTDCPSLKSLETNCNTNVIYPSLEAVEDVISDREKRSDKECTTNSPQIIKNEKIKIDKKELAILNDDEMPSSGYMQVDQSKSNNNNNWWTDNMPIQVAILGG